MENKTSFRSILRMTLTLNIKLKIIIIHNWLNT